MSPGLELPLYFDSAVVFPIDKCYAMNFHLIIYTMVYITPISIAGINHNKPSKYVNRAYDIYSDF